MLDPDAQLSADYDADDQLYLVIASLGWNDLRAELCQSAVEPY